MDILCDTPTDCPAECPRIFLRTYFILVLNGRSRSHFCILPRIVTVTVTQNFYGHSYGLSGGMSADFPTDIFCIPIQQLTNLNIELRLCICYNASRQKKKASIAEAQQRKAPVLQHWGFLFLLLAMERINSIG